VRECKAGSMVAPPSQGVGTDRPSLETDRLLGFLGGYIAGVCSRAFYPFATILTSKCQNYLFGTFYSFSEGLSLLKHIVDVC